MKHACRAIASAISFFAMVSVAFAQQAILQAGPMTPGDVPVYVTGGVGQPVVRDGGPSVLTVPVPITQGGCGATTAAGCRTNIGAAASGPNGDITSLLNISSTLTPNIQPGILALVGIAAVPTLGSPGEGAEFLSNTYGLDLMGRGSVSDTTILSRSGVPAAWVPSTTTNWQVSGEMISSTELVNNGTLTLSGSAYPSPQFQGQIIENLSGSSTINTNLGLATVMIGNGTDTAALPSDTVWNELQISGHFGGTMTGGRIGMSSILFYDTPGTFNAVTNGLVGYASIVKVSANAGGVATGFGVSQFGLGSFFGANPWCNVAPGATYIHSCGGQETDIEIQAGASSDVLVGELVTLVAQHAVHGGTVDAGYVLGSSNGAAVGLRNGFLVGGPRSQWPIDPNGYVFQAVRGSAEPTIFPANAAGGIDLLQANFTGMGASGGLFAFRSQGASIDGSGRGQFGYGLLDGTSGGLTISTGMLELSGTPTIASGGTGYATSDYVVDVYGNVFSVTASAGVVTGVTVAKRGYVTSAPSNPISETSQTYTGSGFGSGLTLNESYAGGSTLTLAANGSGTIAVGSGTDVVTLPVVSTGTPVASLCLDASGHIIKKTTSGACI